MALGDKSLYAEVVLILKNMKTKCAEPTGIFSSPKWWDTSSLRVIQDAAHYVISSEKVSCVGTSPSGDSGNMYCIQKGQNEVTKDTECYINN